MSFHDVAPNALEGDMTKFKNLRGKDLVSRLEPYLEWQNVIRQSGLWFVSKTTTSPPIRECEGETDSGSTLRGINFASQDYLSLSSHLSVKKAAESAIFSYGVHSAGSAALFGNTKFSKQLEQELAQFLGMKYTSLFPTGWGAGFGAIRTLVRKDDHVVLDKLSHACLQEGALASTKKIHYFAHLKNDEVARILKDIRSRDNENGILVITESLFSMDSDIPDLQVLQKICKAFGATLLVDMAHDLGCLGSSGRGALDAQNMVGKIDIVMGSFSKTFASNGGFVCSNSLALREYFTSFSSPRTFSNALSPIQSAVVLESLRIVESLEGNQLREQLMENIIFLRQKLSESGLETIGSPSPIVPVTIGDEGLTRLTMQILLRNGIIANNVEFPAVAKGAARLRLQVMAKHTRSDIESLVCGLRSAIAIAREAIGTIRSKL